MGSCCSKEETSATAISPSPENAQVSTVNPLRSPAPAPVTATVSGVGAFSPTWQNKLSQLTKFNPSYTILFSGYVDFRQAKQESDRAPSVGDRWLCLGGGNDKGKFSLASTKAITSDHFAQLVSSGYKGVCFNTENMDFDAADAIVELVMLANFKGLFTNINVSHSAPWSLNAEQQKIVMQKFCASTFLHALGGQLYQENVYADYAASAGFAWTDYAAARAPQVAHAISAADTYEHARSMIGGARFDNYLAYPQ